MGEALLLQSTIWETPFRLTYGRDVVIPVEIEKLSWRSANPLPTEGNKKDIREEINLFEDKMMVASFTSVVFKQITTSGYNHHVRPREFHTGYLMLQMVDIKKTNSWDG